MALTDMTEFDAVVTRLRLVIEPIVARHHGDGDELTWGVMQDIEQEAVTELENAGCFNPLFINIVRPSPAFHCPQTDEPVDFGKSNAIACSHAMIYEAYRRMH